ncbi:MAG: hypothetical protein JSW40_03730 [Candidatus Omnitrophota bacterium]|nr:MAG: hypothetical protein JSW40_03730 [Candidatus Omnitrophota bacterium]
MKKLTQHLQVRADPEAVFEELIKWQDAQWWPDIPMKFSRLSEKEAEGALYIQKVAAPFAPRWHTKLSCIDRAKKYIKREFLDGMFRGGYEEIFLEDKSSAIDVVYNFCYSIKNPLKKFLWRSIFKRLHIKNINLILHSLRSYLEVQK